MVKFQIGPSLILIAYTFRLVMWSNSVQIHNSKCLFSDISFTCSLLFHVPALPLSCLLMLCFSQIKNFIHINIDFRNSPFFKLVNRKFFFWWDLSRTRTSTIIKRNRLRMTVQEKNLNLCRRFGSALSKFPRFKRGLKKSDHLWACFLLLKFSPFANRSSFGTYLGL